jgi:hypothetical protein
MYSQTWINAENACMDWLLTKLEGTTGQNAFLGAIPRGLVNAWSFGFSGGPDAVLARSNGSYVPCAWELEAEWLGVFSSRETALNYVGMMFDSLPAGANHGTNTIPYVQTMQILRPPTVRGEWLDMANSNQQQQVTMVSLALRVVIKRSE